MCKYVGVYIFKAFNVSLKKKRSRTRKVLYNGAIGYVLSIMHEVLQCDTVGKFKKKPNEIILLYPQSSILLMGQHALNVGESGVELIVLPGMTANFFAAEH